MTCQFIWAGKLHTVPIPNDIIDDRDKMIYTQYYVVDGHQAAMKGVMRARYPGIGWAASTEHPVPFDVAVFGHGPVVPSSEFGTLFPSSQTHSHSQTRPLSSQVPSRTYGASGNGDRRTHGPRWPTSNGPSHRAHALKEEFRPSSSPGPTQNATPRTGGWLGSGPTKPVATAVVQHV
jgi:hypothetical protein